MLSSKAIASTLERTDASGAAVYSQEDILDTLTGLILRLLTQPQTDLTAFGDAEREMLGMALQHAELHMDMEQQQFDEGILRFISTRPPNDALLSELGRALSKPKKKKKSKKSKKNKKSNASTKQKLI